MVMQAIALGIVILAVFIGTAAAEETSAVQNKLPLSFNCTTVKSASGRLICSDEALKDATQRLGYVYAKMKERSGDPEGTSKSQFAWIKERNARCGLDDKSNAPIEQLQEKKPCLLKEINSRIEAFASSTLDRQKKVTGDGTPAPGGNQPFPFVRWEVDCRIYDGRGSYMTQSRVTVDHNQGMLLLDGETALKFLDYTAAGGRKYCEQQYRDGRVDGSLPVMISIAVFECSASCISKYGAVSPKGDGKWDIGYNTYFAERGAAMQQQNMANLRAKVFSEIGTQERVQADELAANPFRYKGRIVAVFTKFIQMNSENEAMFTNFGDINVKGVPSSRFIGKWDEFLLAMRVTGRNAAGAVEGEYVGSYKCTLPTCGELFGF
jgi:uncharacterized protein YecT (DUF1311 family)